jgi:hypothetical protein
VINLLNESSNKKQKDPQIPIINNNSKNYNAKSKYESISIPIAKSKVAEIITKKAHMNKQKLSIEKNSSNKLNELNVPNDEMRFFKNKIKESKELLGRIINDDNDDDEDNKPIDDTDNDNVRIIILYYHFYYLIL